MTDEIFHLLQTNKLNKVKKLICTCYNIDINIKDKYNRTALHYAAKYNDLELMEILIKRGAKTHYRDFFNYTALDLATNNNNLQAIELIKKQQKIEKLL